MPRLPPTIFIDYLTPNMMTRSAFSVCTRSMIFGLYALFDPTPKS